MNDRYRLLDFDEVVALGLEVESDRKYSEWNSYVVEFPDNGPPYIVGKDGGEPEDQTLYRDWRWAVPALNAAFEDGKRIGKILGLENSQRSLLMDNYTKQKVLSMVHDLKILLQPEIQEHHFFVDLMNQALSDLTYVVESACDPDFDAEDEDNFRE